MGGHRAANGLVYLSINITYRAIDNNLPFYCNINIRSEYLDLYRKVLFTEAILDFERLANKKEMKPDLVSRLNTIRTTHEKIEKERASSFNQGIKKLEIRDRYRLHDHDIKVLRYLMNNVSGKRYILWDSFCRNLIETKLLSEWTYVEEEFSLNYLIMRKHEHQFFHQAVEWEQTIRFMENPGIGSADAMIVNLFLSSNFDLIVTSDRDVALTVTKC